MLTTNRLYRSSGIHARPNDPDASMRRPPVKRRTKINQFWDRDFDRKVVGTAERQARLCEQAPKGDPLSVLVTTHGLVKAGVIRVDADLEGNVRSTVVDDHAYKSILAARRVRIAAEAARVAQAKADEVAARRAAKAAAKVKRPAPVRVATCVKRVDVEREVCAEHGIVRSINGCCALCD